ncbi:aldo-keto reductase family 1 member B7-like [Diorhabda sublineata]|uniref:aldo-keto reductase family 1 member B7-like n=1 Tax=Diorhabda sublineata TaxID=1163346 RepID=UPI0024E0C84F|nr:aldo-keto reductase family 1 member B7-like [Diorhabda sublineata]
MPGIGLGTWMSTRRADLQIAITAALEFGYRHFDTAFIYQNEKIIGDTLKDWFCCKRVKREDIFLTTKLPIAGLHEDRVESSIRQSLENLKMDYVDLYLIHFPVGSSVGNSRTPLNQLKLEMSDHNAVWKIMEQQVEESRTKAIGICNFTKKQIEKILNNCKIKPACLQIESHVFLQQKELVDFCQQNNIVVIGFSPLGNPGYNKFLRSIGKDGKQLPNGFKNDIIKGIAEKCKKTPGQVMLRYLIQRNIVPIPKSTNPRRIKENIEVFDFELDSDDLKKLEGLDLGEEGRILDFNFFSKQIRESPEFPFPEKRKESI